MRVRWLIVLGLGLAAFPAAGRGDDWPQFRGPGGTGLSAEKELPAEWGTEKNVQWKVQIPGRGWSWPVVSGDKVFVTTAVAADQRRPPAEASGGRGPGRDEPDRRPGQRG